MILLKQSELVHGVDQCSALLPLTARAELMPHLWEQLTQHICVFRGARVHGWPPERVTAAASLLLK